ncbi:MAG: hypothetical protein IJT21_08575 [Synergistaceae bacterium]|nr:hypothetical protein [Synergistaceae bacterium]
MRKNFLAGLFIALILFSASSCFAESWTGYFGAYWDSWFGSSEQSPDLNADKSESVILPEHLAANWDKLTGSLVEALALNDKQESLPNNAWFGEDKTSNAAKINKLLDAALSILINGEAGKMRHEASQLRAKIANLRIELDDLRNKKITAPDSNYYVLFWRLTKEKADKRIAELEREIKSSEESLLAINAKLSESLKTIGLDLDASQVEILMNSVTGEDLLQNAIIFDNVKKIVAKLEELAQNDTNSIEITRRYSGMYLILNDLLIHTQEELIKKIDSSYKPNLDAIITEASNLQRDAQARSRNKAYTQAQRESFIKNAESNALTIRVAKLYIELLNTQKTGTLASIKSLRLNRDLAENTYRTVRSSGELRGLIHSGLSLFETINALKMPELKIFENGAMRLEFEEINRRLKK